MKLNVLLVDDENNACINLRNMLGTYAADSVQVIGVANSTAEAEVSIKELRPDAVFLDIEMPNENAFQFLARIAPINFDVIFVTAYDEHAVKAFRLNAIDYILKPIDIDELLCAVQKLTEKVQYSRVIRKGARPMPDLYDPKTKRISSNKVTLRDMNSVEVVEHSSIIFIEAQSNYSKIVFDKGGVKKEIVVSNTLMEYEDLLPTSIFFRIHRSFLVNTQHIKQVVHNDKGYSILAGTEELPVSRRKYIPLMDFLKSI